MLFSICIPVYNTAKYLDECLQSVLRQTEKDYEIVLVDDGSTDDSGWICDRYAAEYPNIRVIHKENEGLMMTRRRGFREAKGDYFLCLDSDDAFYSVDALEKVKRMIEEKNADLVIFEYLYAYEKSAGRPDKIISLFSHPNGYIFEGETKKELYNKLLLGKDLNPIWIKAVSRSVLDLDTDYSPWKEELVGSQGEDLFQTLPILDHAKRVAYLKEPLYFYRWNPDSISRNVRPEYYYAYRAIYQRTDEYLEKWGFIPEETHRILQGRINMLMSMLLASAQSNRERWFQVLKEVSEDPFFRNLWEKRDPAYISKYYLLMGGLILCKKWRLLPAVKRSVEALSHVKHKLWKR